MQPRSVHRAPMHQLLNSTHTPMHPHPHTICTAPPIHPWHNAHTPTYATYTPPFVPRLHTTVSIQQCPYVSIQQCPYNSVHVSPYNSVHTTVSIRLHTTVSIQQCPYVCIQCPYVSIQQCPYNSVHTTVSIQQCPYVSIQQCPYNSVHATVSIQQPTTPAHKRPSLHLIAPY